MDRTDGEMGGHGWRAGINGWLMVSPGWAFSDEDHRSPVAAPSPNPSLLRDEACLLVLRDIALVGRDSPQHPPTPAATRGSRWVQGHSEEAGSGGQGIISLDGGLFGDLPIPGIR